MSANHPDDERLLDAAADEHVAYCPACAGRRDAQQAIRSALRSLPRTAPVAESALAVLREHRRTQRRRRVAAVLVAAATIATAVVMIRERMSRPLPNDLANELALDHLHYAKRTDAAEVRGDPQTIASFFARRLGFEPHYGNIEAARFEGARSCRIGGKWTALAWVDRAGHWLSLFAMPQHVARGRGCTTAQGVRVCASPDPRGGARVLVGDLPENEMLRLVDESLQ